MDEVSPEMEIRLADFYRDCGQQVKELHCLELAQEGGLRDPIVQSETGLNGLMNKRR